MRICFSFASRSRPQKFFDVLDNIRDLSESKDYFVWGKLDEDDLFADMYRNRLDEYPELTARWGVSKNKCDAINRSMEALPECDIIVMQSDDMVWESYGFDTEIRNAFKQYFPNLDGVVHFPEQYSANRTMVLSIMGVNLYRQLGYLYHPSFSSVYMDNHITEMTQKMGKYVFIDKHLYSHFHPIWGLAEWDSQYRHTESPEFYLKDKEIFDKLKANNFGLK